LIPSKVIGLQSHQSFTLIEVLVVVSIISLLAALFMPSLQAARESTNQAACMSNLKQIGIAMNMYGNDHATYPWAAEFAWPGIPSTSWVYRIQSYLGKRPPSWSFTPADDRSPVIQCPGRKVKSTNVVNCYGAHSMVMGWKTVSPWDDFPVGRYQRPYPFTQRPAEVLLVADAAQPSSGGGEAFPVLYAPNDDFISDYGACNPNDPSTLTFNNDTLFNSIIRYRHMFNQRANFLMVDGHVESIKYGELKRGNVRISGL
jgi:prepilin-type processing-associated H-X9-DG protein/prepilin-type N-terminal cleavage/methylation domain-containing protein